MNAFTRQRTRAEDSVEGGGESRGFGALAIAAAFLAVAAAAMFFVNRASSIAAVNEDAFISFRYARNLLEGEGLVFNPGGERVEGITNLLWTLVLAGASGVSGAPLPDVSVFLGILFGALAVCVAFAWCLAELRDASVPGPLAVPLALAAPLLVSLAPGFAFYSASGLEVPLFAFLLVTGLFLLCRGRSWMVLALGGMTLGLAAMTRPEGMLALAFGVAACALIPRGISFRERFGRLLAAGVPGAAVVGGSTLWRLLYYGSPVPNTAYAKAGGMEVVERWGIPYLMEAAQGNWFVMAWLAALAGAALDRGFLLRNLAILAVVPVWGAYVVYVGGDYMPFHRLVVPLLPALFVVAVAGFARVALAIPLAGGSMLRRAAVSVVLAAALAFPLISGLPDQFEAEETAQSERLRDNERREEVGMWFRENDPDALVARNGVGAVGYYSEVEMVDMLGLNDAHIAHNGNKHPTAIPGHQASDAEYILDREPEYIMLAEGGPNPGFASDRELTDSPRLGEEYDSVRIELESGREISMLRREDATGTPASRAE